MPEEQKNAILSQEVIRRMRHVSIDVPMKERTKILDNFSDMMEISGYTVEQRRDILVRGLKGYEHQK